MAHSRPRVLLVVGYFDWFSGYQETALTEAFAQHADTEVVASDRVSPAFSDDHIKRLGLARRYQPGSRRENGVRVTRLPCWEKRSMVWSHQARCYIGSREYDLIVQVMPGQLLPIAPSLTRHRAPRVALYGDHRAMWAELNVVQRMLKGIVFTITKGLAYTVVNRRSARIFGYTPNTLHRLRALGAGHRMELMPLAYSSGRFYWSPEVRRAARVSIGCPDDATIILAAGKFEHRKRFDWLIRAFEAVGDGAPNLRLLLVGADGSKDSLAIRRIVSESVVREQITILEFVDPPRLNAVFNASDVAVWPRNPAITIQQAMGTGLFVLLPRNDLVGHLLVDDSCSGCYFDAAPGTEVDALRDALRHAVPAADFSPDGRSRRVHANAWLGADSIVADLLETVAQAC